MFYNGCGTSCINTHSIKINVTENLIIEIECQLKNIKYNARPWSSIIFYVLFDMINIYQPVGFRSVNNVGIEDRQISNFAYLFSLALYINLTSILTMLCMSYVR